MFETVLIVGPGLIGGSLGMALKRRGLAQRIIGVGHRQSSLDAAIAADALTDATIDLKSHAHLADLIVLATGVDAIPMQAAALIPLMKRGAILTDVGSVKGVICAAVKQAFAASAGNAQFIGGHPIAGSEQRGIKAAREDLFEGALCILTPTPETDPEDEARKNVRAMWEAVGSRVVETSPHHHDELLAQVSHLPHLVAAALVNLVSEEALGMAGRGFIDTTRIASGDPKLWVEIALANRTALIKALTGLGNEIRDIADALDAVDADSLLAILSKAKQRRDGRTGN